MRRNQSRSRTRCAADDEELELALQRLADKLKAYQPLYTDEDVVIIPFPGDAGGSPSRSPSRYEGDGSNSSSETLDATHADGSSKVADSDGRPRAPSVVAAKTSSQSGASNAGGPAGGAGGGPSSSSTVNLDIPLSAGLFLAAVNMLEPKMIGKSRRTTLDAVKLIKQGYALVWHDPQCVAERTNAAMAGGSDSSSQVNGLPSGAPSRAASLAPPERHRSGSPGRRGPATKVASGGYGAGVCEAKPRSPAPTFQLDVANALRLDQAVQSLLVYANSSFFLSQHITAHESVLRIFCSVCWAARQIEEAEEGRRPGGCGMGGGGPSQGSSSLPGDCPQPANGGRKRDLERELGRLEAMWGGCGLAGRIVEHLRECYLVEFLLDACLPPAVCSSRYEGVTAALVGKKQRILTDMVASRHGFADMMRVVTLRGLTGIAAMSAYADPKLKARLLDKMASEGLVDRLYDEVHTACEAIRLAEETVGGSAATHDSGKDRGARRSSPARASPAKKPQSPPSTPARKAAAHPADGPPAAPTSRRVSQRRSLSQPTGGDSSRGMAAAPASHSAPPGRPRATAEEMDPVERLGHCLDLLLLLTSPNLRPLSEADELARNPKTAASAVVRPTVWATHEKSLHSLTMDLLWLTCRMQSHRSSPRLASLRASITECMLQVAAYSAVLYAMVIDAVDALLKEASARPAARARVVCADGPSPAAQRSPSATRGTSPPPSTATALLPDPAGALPLMLSLLRHPTHAQANAGSIRRWLRWVADGLLPHAFEAPLLTNGRRSTAAWGKRHKAEATVTEGGGRKGAAPGGSHGAARSAAAEDTLEAPVLARDLSRPEIASLSPYFTFAVRLVTETAWRDGAEPFLAKIALLAYHVVLMNARRCNLCFGQASTCYDVVAPLLLPVGGVIPGDVVGLTGKGEPCGEDEEGGGRPLTGQVGRGLQSPTGPATPSPIAKRRRSTGLDADESAGERDDGEGYAGEDYQLFIPSPSRSPVFYEAYSPAASEVTFISERSPLSPLSSSPPLFATRRSPSEESSDGTPPRGGGKSTEEEGDSAPPRSSPARSWRHSLKMLITSLGGPEEAELKKD